MVKDKMLEDYLQGCWEAADNLPNFKKDPRLTKIWEHASRRTGEFWRRHILADNPWLFDLPRIFDNDKVGNPDIHQYDGINASANTLQYIGVLSNLISRFGSLNKFHIVEIGGGYGGQALIIKTVFPRCHYTIIDLPNAERLQRSYLSAHNKGSQSPMDLWDLCISNYALSEIKDPLQTEYVEKYCKKSSHGYVTANIEIPSLDWGSRGNDIPTERETNFLITW